MLSSPDSPSFLSAHAAISSVWCSLVKSWLLSFWQLRKQTQGVDIHTQESDTPLMGGSVPLYIKAGGLREEGELGTQVPPPRYGRCVQRNP